MVDKNQLKLIKEGVEVWNKWRNENPDVEVDLNHANLIKADLSGADLSGANLRRVTCYGTNLSHANLTETNLQNAGLVETQLEQAILTGSIIYGLSAWGLKGTPKHQANLFVHPHKA